MDAQHFFDMMKSKRIRKSFALVDMDVKQVEAWFIDFTSLTPVKAVWSERGLVSALIMDADDYLEAWTEYRKECAGHRVDTLGWEVLKRSAALEVTRAVKNSAKRFWMSVIDALDYMQIDTRV